MEEDIDALVVRELTRQLLEDPDWDVLRTALVARDFDPQHDLLIEFDTDADRTETGVVMSRRGRAFEFELQAGASEFRVWRSYTPPPPPSIEYYTYRRAVAMLKATHVLVGARASNPE